MFTMDENKKPIRIPKINNLQKWNKNPRDVLESELRKEIGVLQAELNERDHLIAEKNEKIRILEESIKQQRKVIKDRKDETKKDRDLKGARINLKMEKKASVNFRDKWLSTLASKRKLEGKLETLRQSNETT